MNAVLRLMNCAVLHATLHRGLYSDPFLNKDIEVNIRGWIMVVAQMSRSEKISYRLSDASSFHRSRLYGHRIQDRQCRQIWSCRQQSLGRRHTYLCRQP